MITTKTVIHVDDVAATEAYATANRLPSQPSNLAARGR